MNVNTATIKDIIEIPISSNKQTYFFLNTNLQIEKQLIPTQ